MVRFYEIRKLLFQTCPGMMQQHPHVGRRRLHYPRRLVHSHPLVDGQHNRLALPWRQGRDMASHPLPDLARLQARLEHANGGDGAPSNGGSLHTLQEMERRHFVAALTATRGVIEGPRGVAKMLDLKPSTARFRIRKLGIRREDFVVR